MHKKNEPKLKHGKDLEVKSITLLLKKLIRLL